MIWAGMLLAWKSVESSISHNVGGKLKKKGIAIFAETPILSNKLLFFDLSSFDQFSAFETLENQE